MKQQDFDICLEKAFAPMPPEFHETIEFAFERGERTVKKRHKIISLLTAAAVGSIVFAVAAVAVSGLNAPRPDNVALFQPTPVDSVPELVPNAPEGETALHASELQPMEALSEETTAEEDAYFYNGDYSEPEALYILLTDAYWAYARENNLDADSRAIYAAANELKNIALENPGETNQWYTPIRECLQSTLGFDQDFIAQHYMMNQVVACLQRTLLPGQEEEPELQETVNASQF